MLNTNGDNRNHLKPWDIPSINIKVVAWAVLPYCLGNFFLLNSRGRSALIKSSLWRRKWQPTPVFLPGESHGQRGLVGYSPRVAKSRTRLSDFTFTFTRSRWASEMVHWQRICLLVIPGWEYSRGEGNGNPLQYSCLKNPMDRGPGGLQSMELQS